MNGSGSFGFFFPLNRMRYQNVEYSSGRYPVKTMPTSHEYITNPSLVEHMLVVQNSIANRKPFPVSKKSFLEEKADWLKSSWRFLFK